MSFFAPCAEGPGADSVPKGITVLLLLRLLALFWQQTPNLATDQRQLGTGSEGIELWRSGSSMGVQRAAVQATQDLSCEDGLGSRVSGLAALSR